jgi:hypothetical protein
MIDDFRAQLKMLKDMEKTMSKAGCGEMRAQKKVLMERLTNNMRVGDVTLKNFMGAIQLEVEVAFDMDTLRRGMSKSKGQGQERGAEELEQWERFKLWGFARTISAAYLISLLHLLIKVQQSVVSRYMLVAVAAPESDQMMATRVNKKFLSYAEHAQKGGAALLCRDVLEAVTAVLGEQDLKEAFTPEKFEACIADIQARFRAKCEHEGGLFAYVFAPTDTADAAALNEMAEAERHVKEAALELDREGALQTEAEIEAEAVAADARARARSPGECLLEMVAETKAVLGTAGCCNTLGDSLEDVFGSLLAEARNAWMVKGETKPEVAFASTMVKFIKQYGSILCPDMQQSQAAALLAGQEGVTALCSVIFFPLEVTTSEDTPEGEEGEEGDEMKQLMAMMASLGGEDAMKEFQNMPGFAELTDNSNDNNFDVEIPAENGGSGRLPPLPALEVVD